MVEDSELIVDSDIIENHKAGRKPDFNVSMKDSNAKIKRHPYLAVV